MRFVAGLAASLLLLSSLPVRATVIEALSMRELVTAADVIAQVQVLETSARMDELDRIVTDARLRIDEPLWSAEGGGRVGSGSEIVVTRLGGELGELGLRVEGEPTFPVGDSMLVFAEERGGELRAVGMSQGVMPIRREAAGPAMVLPGGAGLALVAPGHAGRLAAPAALLAPRPLQDVLDEVRALIDEVHGAR